jgi:hypothetical protein
MFYRQGIRAIAFERSLIRYWGSQGMGEGRMFYLVGRHTPALLLKGREEPGCL